MLAIFFDLKRAFETLDRNILIKTMRAYGIGGKVIEWFESWLADRTQQVRFNSEVSNEKKIELGIPQGTPLSCTLFNIYINLLTEQTNGEKMLLLMIHCIGLRLIDLIQTRRTQ